MKMSIWNLLTLLLLIGTFGMVVVFGASLSSLTNYYLLACGPINVPPALSASNIN